MTASLCFHVLIYPCCLKIEIESRLHYIVIILRSGEWLHLSQIHYAWHLSIGYKLQNYTFKLSATSYLGRRFLISFIYILYLMYGKNDLFLINRNLNQIMIIMMNTMIMIIMMNTMIMIIMMNTMIMMIIKVMMIMINTMIMMNSVIMMNMMIMMSKMIMMI